jgi:hypothetical protein
MTMSQADKERYERAIHAMQSGVAFEMAQSGGPDPGDTAEKHLRVGVNSALCDSAALARLLVEKGVITQDELERAVADEMEREVDRYRARIREATGADVHLA